MGDDEWTIVKIKKNSKSHSSNNNNKRNNTKKKNSKNNLKSNIVINNNDDDDGSSYDDVMKTINTTTIELKRSSYYNKLIETIKTSLESKNSNNISNNNDDDICEYKLKEIVSLGIGSFSKSPSALLQLVMTLCLAQEFLHDSNNDDSKEPNKYNCIVFDPIFNDVEVLVCNSLGLNASKENKFGKHNAVHDNDSQYKTTLFFMPHCPYRLYCNLLWKNWSNLANLMIYGNSFSSYGLRRMHALSSEKTDLTDCIVCMESFIVERSLALDISRHNMPKELLHLENAFNDLSIHYFNNDSLSSKEAQDLLKSKEKPTENEIDNASALDEELF